MNRRSFNAGLSSIDTYSITLVSHDPNIISAQHFVESFLSETNLAHKAHEAHFSSIPILHLETFSDSFKSCNGRRILFLDHEGTLISSPKHKGLALPSIEQTELPIKLLMALVSDPRNIVYVTSNRQQSELIDLEAIEGLGLSAENGGFIRYAGESRWESCGLFTSV
jgi:hypothetical protein